VLERIENLPNGITGLRATGTVSKDDYDDVVHPLLSEARREGRRIRLLYHLPPEFDGFTPGAAWEDAHIGFRHLRLFERLAIVSDKDWIRGVARGVGMLLPCPNKVFRDAEWDEALAWLGAAGAAVNVEHRLIPEQHVLLVEPKAKLGIEDFDAIAMTVDPWVESGGELRGLVVHAREFPGWETIGSFLRHVRFVREHHRNIRRVALAADGALPKLAPVLVEAFVNAEIRHFAFDELDWAIEWAGRPDARPTEDEPKPPANGQP